jgi:hypothetical protein
LVRIGILSALAAPAVGAVAAQQSAAGDSAVQAPPSAAAPAAGQGQAPACAAQEYGQFDFWVGAWDVYRTGGDRLVGRSLIEKLYDGCGVRENWMPVGRAGGGSLNSFVPDAGEWRQIWIDSANSWAEFRGGLQGGAMVLSGTWRGMNGPGTAPLVRISYIPQQDRSIRQLGEQSTDDGQSWTTAFDFTYRRSAAASAATPGSTGR